MCGAITLILPTFFGLPWDMKPHATLLILFINTHPVVTVRPPHMSALCTHPAARPYTPFFWAGHYSPLNENKLMGISGVFMNNTWSHDLGFYWSWSEAQKGAEDMGQIKALGEGLPVTRPSIKCKYSPENSWYLPGILLLR